MTPTQSENSNAKIIPYVRLFFGIAVTVFIASQAQIIFSFFHHGADAELLSVFFAVSLIFILSFIVFYLTAGTAFPSFVTAIFFGMAAKPLLEPLVGNHVTLGVLVGLGATLILFGGGLETPWKNFVKLFWKITSLSFVGLLLTALALSLVLAVLGQIFGQPISIAVAILLGAILASTDPAAIIPVLKQLRFNNRDVKDLIVSESAMTDVTGTLLTVVFLSMMVGGAVFSSVALGYQQLLSVDSGLVFFKQLAFGVIFGVIGYSLLEALTHLRKRHDQEFEADAAFFLFVPVMIFSVALALGGSGYLAAFIAGLLFISSQHFHDTEKFLNQTIEGFFKPTIFLLLGALVDLPSLIAYAPIGIAAALIFMFIIRPVAVFISLGPFSFFGKARLDWRDLLFVSFIRETGAIPAVLLITVVSSGLTGLEGLVSIGMWIILATLILEPPLTPLVAKWLKVATTISDEKDVKINGGTEQFVVLGSRGRSFEERIDTVVNWADRHNIKRVVLLHCLEDKYTPELATEIGIAAEGTFAKVNKQRELSHKSAINFMYVSRTGFLQQNIDEMTKTHDNISAIFVGKKVLDYRLSDIKNLAAPLYFLD